MSDTIDFGHRVSDTFDGICDRWGHDGTEMEVAALEAAERHGLSEEYTLARFYAHPGVVDLGYEDDEEFVP